MKLYIVEDEKLCRETIINIPWQNIGVFVAGSAENAEDALEAIRAIRPDIIITDIRMPSDSGIDLAKKLHTFMPDVKIIFLTAYNDFDYAEKAIKYNVFDYILKPVRSECLMDSVKRARDAVVSERKQKNDLEQLNHIIAENKYFLKSYFLTGVSNPSSQENIMQLFNISGGVRFFSALALSFFPKYTEQPEVDYMMIFKHLNVIARSDAYTVVSFYDHMVFTYVFAFQENLGQGQAFDMTINTAETMQEYLEFNLDGIFFTIGIGDIVERADEIPFAAKRANEAIKYRFYLGNNRIICINDIEPIRPDPAFHITTNEKLIDIIKIGDEASAIEMIKTLFDNLGASHTSIENVQRICLEILVMLSTTMSQFGYKPDVLFNNTEPGGLLRKHNTIKELEQLILNVTQVAISRICFDRNTKNDEIVEKVKALVSEGYNSDISLTEIARQVHISPCYLSVIFSKSTNTTFKNFIMQTRIDHSRKLLENSALNISEIANAVGYKSQKYFSFLFHRMTGMMPTEYRALHKLQSSEPKND